MAALAFRRCEQYDDVIAGWLEGVSGERAGLALRYGENPHQAAVLGCPGTTWPAWAWSSTGARNSATTTSSTWWRR